MCLEMEKWEKKLNYSHKISVSLFFKIFILYIFAPAMEHPIDILLNF